MAERMAKFGLGELSIKRIQGRCFLIEVPDEEYMEVLKQNDWAYLKECFITIEPWSGKRFVIERVTWIENGSNSYEKMEMLITINQPNQIEELIMMEVGNCKFPIRVKERGLLEEKIENPLKGRNMPEEDGGESPEVESGTRSESKLCPDERRNNVGENLTSEENFQGNNKSLFDEGVGTGLEVDRAREDLLNMGLNNQVVSSEVYWHHKYVDQMVSSLGENRLTLRSGSSLVESDEGGNGSGDRRVILREAKRTWEVGKKLGLCVRGDEEEVIEEIGRLEGQ
ncbi:hypothetical protein GOBAR_AA05079 [Gossypium barbadense]|uniref:DUF4283 domain-containing protein n=1 Tax=Gossypium barbadense TaxID=3634 RepID=A0A2P5YIT1_GOSBA|nr:hypothetical protein GOBAR_AA05079 [Gossypium barbadense]